MNTSIINSLILVVFAAFLIGAGHYVTDVHQPRKLQEIEDKITLAKLQQAQVSQLLVEQAESAELAEEGLRKWRARYKSIPVKLNTADMVLYLEGLTSYGFEQFDVQLQGITNAGDFSYYTFQVHATAFFDPLFRFIWHIENNREFYRIDDLKMSHTTIYKDNTETGLPRRLDMVRSSFKLHAYFAAREGISAEDDDLVPIPDNMLPRRSPAHNSFYPIVRTDLPPNDEQLLDIENSTLLSIVGDRAIFLWDGRQYIVSEGDRVYLGDILKIDPKMALVRVRLNKGGKSAVFDVKLEVQERFRQGQGGELQVQPIDEF